MRDVRPAVLVGCAMVLFIAACGEQSRVDPDQVVTVSGVVSGPDGPAAGRPVQLGVGVTPSDGAFAVLTVGLHCTSGACSGRIDDAETDEAGAYRFELEGRDTQSSFGEAEPVLVSVVGEAGEGEVSGPLSSARFRIQAAEVVLLLELVDADLRVEGTGAVAARWEPVRPGPYELLFEEDDSRPVWRARAREPETMVDPRFLEDTAGRVVVSGRAEDAVEGSDVELVWRSGGVPYVAGAGAPPSRGRPCRYIGPGDVLTGNDDDCGLTDGDLTSPAAIDPICTDQAARDCGPAEAVVLDLGGDVPAEIVVVRGCDGGCAVDTSADGTAFVPAGSVSDEFGAATLDGQPIRFVRVGLGEAPGDLHEVSVWGPAPETALRSVAEGDRSRIAEPYRPSDATDERSLVLVVVAGLVLLATVAGLAFVLGRRGTMTP